MVKRAIDAEESSSYTAETRPSKRTRVDPVKKSNALSPKAFKECFIECLDLVQTVQQDGGEVSFDVDYYAAASLSQHDFDACFNLIKTTSASDYKRSTMKWRPDHKKHEMRDPDMHYMIVRRRLPQDADGRSDHMEGFLSFMLDHDSLPCVPVLYVYEIHLAESVRGLGLGAKLLGVSEELASRVGVDKVMLTCFLSNTNAAQFYQHHGYSQDAVSPGDRQTRNKVVKADYVIMSKVVARGTGDERS